MPRLIFSLFGTFGISFLQVEPAGLQTTSNFENQSLADLAEIAHFCNISITFFLLLVYFLFLLRFFHSSSFSFLSSVNSFFLSSFVKLPRYIVLVNRIQISISFNLLHFYRTRCNGSWSVKMSFCLSNKEEKLGITSIKEARFKSESVSVAIRLRKFRKLTAKNKSFDFDYSWLEIS
jgi:hypothetical protein